MADMMLVKHGTTPVDLPLGAIITAAETDLRRRFAKEMAGADYRAASIVAELGASYAFAPKHIRRAKSAAELLLIAAQEPGLADRTTMTNRALLYRNPERLVDAAERALASA